MIDVSKKLSELYGKEHLSYSSLKVALTDMAKFDLYMKGELKFESKALDFGTLYDMLLFEREKAMEHYMVVNDDMIMDRLSDKARSTARPKATSEWKAAVDYFNTQALEDGRVMCSPEDWKTANDMIDRLHDTGLYNEYISPGDYQVEFNERLNGVVVKGFLDCLGSDFIVDSKSTKSVEKFRYSVRDFSYDIQAYIYTKVFGINKFYWLAQEKTYPYLPAIVECSEETLFAGEMKFMDAVRRITNFLTNDKPPTQDYLKFKV